MSISRSLALATGMLTVLRIPVPGSPSAADLRASTALYPVAGLLVGAVPAACLLLPVPVLPRAVLALAAWVAVTGALHLDGWADCCDAAFAPARMDAEETRLHRLAILKDPRVGTFGAAGVVLLLMGKWSSLVYAPALAPLLAAPVGRWCMVLTLRAFPPARADGLGAAFAGPVPLQAATALLFAVQLAVVAWLPLRAWGTALLVTLIGMAAGAALAWSLARRLGGITGDVCGAAGEAAELAVLWALLPWGTAG